MRRAGGSRRAGPLLTGLAACALASGCGSNALTHPPRTHGAPPSHPPTALSGPDAVSGALTKLRLISQDGCQTEPPERIYPLCERFLAELRSAVGTVRGGAATLPNGSEVAATSRNLFDAAAAYDRDGCGSGPYSSGPQNAQACVADLRAVRSGLNILLAQTHQR
jgi:hypothetical protein